MKRSPHDPPRGTTLRDRLITCLWWLIFLGGVGAGSAVGVVLALWLALAPLPALTLIVACWFGGNVGGWWLAARLDAAVARRDRKDTGRKHVRSAPVAARFAAIPG